MISSGRFVKSRMPALSAEIETCLQRMGREDLAEQMAALGFESEERNPEDGRRSFLVTGEARRYSIEIDLRGALIIVDVNANHRIVALHVLSAQD